MNTDEDDDNVLKYPCFLMCCPFENQIEYEQILEDMAFGIFPDGAIIDHDTNDGNTYIYFNASRFTIPKDDEIDYRKFHRDLKIFFFGSNAVDPKTPSGEAAEEHPPPIEWNKIKKYKQEIMILRYILRMEGEHRLSEEQSERLENLLRNGLLFKTLDVDVTEDGNDIHAIRHLEFRADGSFEYTNPPRTKQPDNDTILFAKSKAKPSLSSTKKMRDKWVAFVKSIGC